MGECMRLLPLSSVERVEICINRGVRTLAEVKALTGADCVINGGLFEGSRAVCHLKTDGTVYASDPYTYWGYAWDQGPDMALVGVPAMAKRNYICCVCLVRGGKAEHLIYNADLGGSRPRTAMGLKGGALALYCSSGGQTPEELQRMCLEEGWDSAVMLDGGGSSQCDLGDGQRLTASRKVHNLICVYLKKKEGTPVDKFTVCLDPGHGPDTVNASPDGTYRESEFAWDMYGRIAKLLEERGVRTVCTRREDNKPSLTERANVSNRAGADCFVSLHSNASGSGGWSSASGLELYTSSGPDSAPRNVLANFLAGRFRAAGVKLRQAPVKHNMELTVLVKTAAPAVLVEYGFHTNEEDVDLLKDASYRDRLARATADGICDFLGVEVPADPVPDEPDEWASEEWEAAKKAGIMDGTRPHDPLTRQEAACILYRAGII